VKVTERGAHGVQPEQLPAVPCFGQAVGVEQHARAGRRSLRALHASGVRANPERGSLFGRDQLPAVVQQARHPAAARRLLAMIGEATRDYLAARQPSGRFVAMEGVGAMVVFLCSQAAQDITGATLPIDGGWSIA